MKMTPAIFVSMAFATRLVAPAAGAATNAVCCDRAGATAQFSGVPAPWPALTLAVNSGMPCPNPASATNVSTDTQIFTTEACCEETTSSGHYSISPTGGLTKASSIERTRHAVTFFTDAAISVGRAGGSVRRRDDVDFSRVPSGATWPGIDAGVTPEPHGLRLLSWSW